MVSSYSVTDWRSNISPQMFSKSLKTELRAAYFDYNHDYSQMWPLPKLLDKQADSADPQPSSVPSLL